MRVSQKGCQAEDLAGYYFRTGKSQNEQIGLFVSVGMLTEGWDTNKVTQFLVFFPCVICEICGSKRVSPFARGQVLV